MQGIDELTAALQSGNLILARQLLEQDRELLTRNGSGGISPMMAAIYSRNAEAIAYIRSLDAEINVFAASALGDLPAVQHLVEADPSLCSQHSPDGWTALHLAGFFNQLAPAEYLIGRGANVAELSTNALANTPLHAAVAGGSLAVSRLLLNRGADPNAHQHGGYTPLQGAVAAGLVELVDLLLTFKADAAALSESGDSAASLARKKGHLDIAKRLESISSPW